MTNINILIIEDDPIWELKIRKMVNQLNRGVNRFVRSLAEADQQLEKQLPDLVIADIVLPDGLSLNLLTQKYKHLPVIFQTAFKNDYILQKALKIPNVYFLTKPFQSFGLQAAIELLISRSTAQTTPAPLGIAVTGKHRQSIQLPFYDIYSIKSEGNYSIISRKSQKYVLKKSLRKVAETLTGDFIQIQKSYIVNRNYIERINNKLVQINQQLIPIGRTYKKKLLATFTLANSKW